MASAFSNDLMASGGGGGWFQSREILGTTKGMTMKFIPDVGIHKEAQNKKKFDKTGRVCKLRTKIPKIPIFGNAASRHANFATFYRIVIIDVRN